MPAGDGTGPSGRGPLTGRRRGYCGGQDATGRGLGRGRGGGGGGGRGQGQGRDQGWGRDGNLGPPNMPPEEEVQSPLAESSKLKRELEDIEKRLEELEKNNPPA